MELNVAIKKDPVSPSRKSPAASEVDVKDADITATNDHGPQPGPHPARLTHLPRTKEIVIKLSAETSVLSELPKDTVVFVCKMDMERDASGKALITFSSTWSPFPFLKLPAEIRNEVYRRVLAISSPDNRINMKINHKGKLKAEYYGNRACFYHTDSWQNINLQGITALLQTNRQLHQEGLAFLYGRNYFHFSQSSGLVRLLTNGPQILPFLGSVSIGNLTSSGKAQRTKLLMLLKDATALRELIILSLGHTGGRYEADWIRQDFKNIMPFVDGMIRNHGSLEAAAESIKFPWAPDLHGARAAELQQLIKDKWTEADSLRQNEAKKVAARLSRLRPRRRK